MPERSRSGHPAIHEAASLLERAGFHLWSALSLDNSNQAPAQLQIDDSKAISLYMNFCRVIGTPEEIILDFALNSQMPGVSAGPVTISQRVITNYYTAKRLLHVLQLTLDRHEDAFGALETDVRRRIRRP